MLKINESSIARFKKEIQSEGMQELERKMVETASSIEREAAQNTPVASSLLKKTWTMSGITRIGRVIKMSVYNPTHYAVHVEFGHRTRQGTGKTKSKLGSKGYVEGQFMLKNAVDLAFKGLK